MKDIGLAGTLCMVTVIVAGCSLMPDRAMPPAVHDFGPAPVAQRFEASDWSSVVVQSPEWLQDPRLRYRLLYRQPSRVNYYALDRWVAPPPDLLAQRLNALAGRSGCRLEIELQAFEQLFQQPDKARVIIEFLARAVDPAGEPRKVVAEKTFSLSRASSSPDAAGAVDAFSHLMNDTIDLLEFWLRQRPEASLCAPTFSAETRSSPAAANPR